AVPHPGRQRHPRLRQRQPLPQVLRGRRLSRARRRPALRLERQARREPSRADAAAPGDLREEDHPRVGRCPRGRGRGERPGQRRRAGVRGAAGQGARRENRARPPGRGQAPARREPDALLGDAARAQARAPGARPAHRGGPARAAALRRARDREAALGGDRLGMAERRKAIATAAVMVGGSLAWVTGIWMAGLEGAHGFFGPGPLIADANLVLEVFLVAGISYGFLLARSGRIDAHQVNQTTWVVLNLGLIVLVMAGSMQDVAIAKASDLASWRTAVTWLHALVGTL